LSEFSEDFIVEKVQGLQKEAKMDKANLEFERMGSSGTLKFT
jgi:hypothetical protein